ncbi:hypothetical protein [Chamaesiphon polymorphus]|uniref:Uncharacterized protein n=1 Tax=Chamaesiphon polymorphus CCALA 037 TaxID=2107692 RepID=A0A2T1GL77_9CYAN|nr:hypothetical protein [Chamaesiphon polymorphus]PSB58611.1 hypothetical protein C7B77_04075 [Chamaesiphon polymorphus CCALA 037]
MSAPKTFKRYFYNCLNGLVWLLPLVLFSYCSYDFIISDRRTELSKQDIRDRLRHLTSNCVDGGINPKGIAYSVSLTDRYGVWYEVDISDAQIECMQRKKIFTIEQTAILCTLKEPCDRQRLAPPEWFQPKIRSASIKRSTGADATVWKPMVEKHGRYFISYHSG